MLTEKSFTLTILFYKKQISKKAENILRKSFNVETNRALVPSSTIPNRLVYRSNPEKKKELQRQLEKLLEKRHTVRVLSLVPSK